MRGDKTSYGSFIGKKLNDSFRPGRQVWRMFAASIFSVLFLSATMLVEESRAGEARTQLERPPSRLSERVEDRRC